MKGKQIRQKPNFHYSQMMCVYSKLQKIPLIVSQINEDVSSQPDSKSLDKNQLCWQCSVSLPGDLLYVHLLLTDLLSCTCMFCAPFLLTRTHCQYPKGVILFLTGSTSSPERKKVCSTQPEKQQYTYMKTLKALLNGHLLLMLRIGLIPFLFYCLSFFLKQPFPLYHLQQTLQNYDRSCLSNR